MTSTSESGPKIMSSSITARVAGIAFLIYIAGGIASLVLTQAAGGSGDIATRLASMAENVALLRYAALLDLVCAFCALTLAVTLYALTSAHGATTAMLAMVCRIVEGVLVTTSLSDSLAILWLADEPAESSGAVHVLASYVMRSEVTLTSIFFAAGSLLFAWLLLRGRLIPAPLAWLGVFASLLLLVVLPPQLVGLASDPRLAAAWLPMLLFEVPLALWLIVRGVRSSS
jgi:hypothetical protein